MAELTGTSSAAVATGDGSDIEPSIVCGPPLDARIAALTGPTLVDLLDRAVARTPRRTALVLRRGAFSERWTYLDLAARVECVSGRLAALGVGPGDRVVTWAPSDPWLVAALFATWRLCAIAVPLDLRMLEDVALRIALRTQPTLVLAGEAQAAGPARALGAPVVCLTAAEFPGTDVRTPAVDACVPDPRTGAEIVFTSGTTSDPKGVYLTHGQVVHNARVIAQTGMGPRAERGLAIVPLSHMYGQIVPLFLGLISGSRLVFVEHLGARSIGTALRQEHITVVTAVPQLAQLLLDTVEAEAARRGELGRMLQLRRLAGHLPMPVRRLLFRRLHAVLGGCLSVITSGSAPMPPALQEAWEAMGVLVVQGYGGTECAAISGHTRRSRRPGTAGKPLAGLEVRIAADGELLVRGPSVMSGYWDAPEATAEVLTPDGWFHSGDAARIDEHGEVIILGRTRDRITLPNGLKVYPDDVERALCRSDAIAAAVALEFPPGRIATALVPAGPEASDDVLARAVKTANQALAQHQRISAWRRWPDPDLPRTHTLKVRREVVMEWYRAGLAGAAGLGRAGGPSIAQPRPTIASADVAEQVASLLAEVTAEPGRTPPSIGPETPLDQLALDSLTRVSLALRIHEILGVLLPDEDVASAATVADLVARIEARQGEGERAPVRAWALSLPARLARELLDRTLTGWLLEVVARPRVEGLAHLGGLPGPILICPNHASHLDAPAVRRALPSTRRRRTAVAAAADYFFTRPLLGTLVGLTMAAIPFGRTRDVSASMERVGALLSEGWSVMLFPEGTRSMDGRLGPMHEGIGLLAVSSGVPVIPTWIEGTHDILPKGRALPRRRRGAHVTIRFGAPLRFDHATSPTDATRTIGQAIARLGQGQP